MSYQIQTQLNSILFFEKTKNHTETAKHPNAKRPTKNLGPQTNNKKCPHDPHPNRWGCSWWRWSFCSVVFPRPSTLWITAWWTSMASGEAQDWGEAAGLKRWNPAPTPKGQGAGLHGSKCPNLVEARYVTWRSSDLGRMPSSPVPFNRYLKDNRAVDLKQFLQEIGVHNNMACDLTNWDNPKESKTKESKSFRIDREIAAGKHGTIQIRASPWHTQQSPRHADFFPNWRWSGTSSTKLVETVGRYMVSLVSQTQVLKMEHLRECMLRASQVEQPAVAEDPTTEVIL